MQIVGYINADKDYLPDQKMKFVGNVRKSQGDLIGIRRPSWNITPKQKMEYFIVSKDSMAWFQNRIEFMFIYFFVWKELGLARSCRKQ